MSDPITPMTMAHYDEVIALWRVSEGIGLSDADSRENIARYLGHNAGMSFVARENGRIIGAVLCGHDGRRGYLHHLAVAAPYRRRGIGQALVGRSLEALRAAGITKCHLFLFRANPAGEAFWTSIGWKDRTEIRLMSRDIADPTGSPC